MGEWIESEWTLVYLNPDGTWIDSAFKSHYNAEAFMDYGYCIVPYALR